MRTPFFVISPSRICCRDVPLLPALGSASEQHNEFVAMSSKVNAIAWPEIDPVLQDTATYRLHVRQIAQFDPRQCNRHLGCCR
jgi:hypothetical protein